jgi:hypothetical protein
VAVKIPLTQGLFALVDDEVEELVNQYVWHAARGSDGRVYACTKLPMHRLLTNAPKGLMVDHIDGNTLSNLSSNLRLCTNSQNQANANRRTGRSGYKGVVWATSKRKWWVRFNADGKVVTGRYFDDPEEAAREADRLMTIHHGQFARLNFSE